MAIPATAFEDIPLDDVKGVLIDLDNTLYAYDPAHEAALEQVYAEWPYAVDSHNFHTEYRTARQTITDNLKPLAACRSRLLAFQLIAEQRGLSAPFSFATKMETLYWESFLDAMTMDEGALEFLHACDKNDIPVCIVSDMLTYWQMRKIDKLGIEPLIARLVTSEEAGAEKPDPRMFNKGLEKLGLSAQQVIMIGDDWAKDIKGAQALGIRPYRIQLIGGHA